MNTENILFDLSGRYQTPVVSIMDIHSEGLLCTSTDFTVENEDFGEIIPL